jgi:homoserine O-acetyltransferase
MEAHIYQHQGPFALESGRSLENLALTYHTAGQYDPARNNVIWICHAFTANSDPSEWWEGLVGDGNYFNSRDHFIVCVNMIGSCYGSTGPLSVDPATGKPYYSDFPLVTIRDMVRSMQLIKDVIGITKIRFAVGFSMGGQKLLEWIYQEPGLFQDVLLGATNAFHSPWGVAFNESQRMAIAADSTFGEPNEKAGLIGMSAARSIGLISYRNYRAYCKTQKEINPDVFDDYRAASYQRYQGEKLMKRFNAYSYWVLSKAMDSHNMARKRGDLQEVLGSIQTQTHLVGIRSDYLFPLEEQQFLHEHIPGSKLTVIDSDYGHDGFLIEYVQMQGIISRILDRSL